METFIVLQVIWDMTMILLFSIGVSLLIGLLAHVFFTEEQIINFLNKYGA